MRSLLVVVRYELTQDSHQVLFVQHNEAVETLSPQGANHSLGTSVAVGAWTGLAMASMPMRAARRRKSRPLTLSRSCSRCRGLWPQGVASITWRQTRAAV